MHALFRDAEVTERDERLHLSGLLIGRKLDTSAGLTTADANLIIDALERLAASGHADGLAGAVTDLLNTDALRQAEQDIAAEAELVDAEAELVDAEQATNDDDARSES